MWWDAMNFIFWMLSFTPALSLYSFTLIKRLLYSSFLSATRVVSFAYLRLLILFPEILIPFCDSSSLAFPKMFLAFCVLVGDHYGMGIYFLSPAFFFLLYPHDQRIRLLFISNEFLIVYFFLRAFFFFLMLSMYLEFYWTNHPPN